MTENETKKFAFYRKVAWAIYTLVTILVIVVLVFVVANDNEEKLFYSLMTAAAAYVFRPSDETITRKIKKVMGSAGEMEGK